MRIKKRLQINFALSLLMVFVIFLLLSMSLYRLNKANNLEKIADEIKSGAFERVALRNDYIRNNTDRAKEQWYAKHEQVGRFLESAMVNFRSAEERKSVAGLIEVHEAIGRIFSAIVANRDRRSLNPDSADLSREVEERLLNQLDMRVYEVAILSRQLLKLSTEKRDSALRLAAGGVLLALLILVASATLNSWAMSRTITSRMLRLRDSATVIGEGNLDHKIDVTGDDEFAEISEAFNTMTAKLGESYRALEGEIVERKRAEIAMRESEERFRLFMDNSPTIAWVKDDQGRHVYISKTFETRFGVKLEDWRGKTDAELWPPEVAETFRRNDRAVLDADRPIEAIEETINPDGSRCYWLTAKFPFRDADGNSYVAGTGLDITERRRAEDLLQSARLQAETEKRNLEAVLQSLPVGVIITDAQGGVLMTNGMDERIWGTRPDTRSVDDYVQYKAWWADSGKPVEPHEWASAQAVLKGEAVFGQVLEIQRFDGGRRFVYNSAVPIRDAEDRVIGSVVAVQDITELRNAEEALRESEQKYRNLFENMVEEVHYWQVVRDEDGRIKTWRLVDANPPTLKSWGRRTAEEIRGKTTDEIFGPGATEHYMPIVEKIMTEGVPYSFEDYFPNLGKHFRFTSVPLGDYFITTGADITVIKQAQESLKASLAEKEVLLKEIHHRVKNNMQVISSLVSLQANQLQDAGMRAILDEMAQRVRSMAMVHEKLYQSHNLAGVEFSDYARSLLNYLWRSHASAASAVRLTLDLEPVSLTVNTAVPCGLILNELVSNALKHAFRGRNGGEVTVSLHSAKGGLRLSVRDDGTGLPAGFDWKQAKSLGLRLVQMLAGQLHADVEVSSDRGTEFTIAFEEPKT